MGGLFFLGFFFSFNPGKFSGLSPGTPDATKSSLYGVSSSPDILSPSFGFLPFFGFFLFDFGATTSSDSLGTDDSESASMGISSLPCLKEVGSGRFFIGFFFSFNPGLSSGSSFGTSSSSESSSYGMVSSSDILFLDFGFLPFLAWISWAC
eukprot:UN08436